MGDISLKGREELLREPVEDVKICSDTTLKELIRIYSNIHGFMADHIVRAINILSEGLRKSNVRFISFTGNLIATGIRGIFAQAIREGLFNVVVTTCGAIDHDIARGFKAKYYKGFFEADDSFLRKLDIHRLGNIYVPVESYGPTIEKAVHQVLDEVTQKRKEWSVYELLWEIGARIDDENSILRAAYKKKAPVFVPGWPDGAFGTALFTYSQLHRFKIDYFKDMSKLAEIVFTNKGKSTALIVGGGISKHHVIWWSQFMGGLDYVVYITTAVEYDGSLSGAHPREAISWGKLKPTSKHVVVYGDATIIVPLILGVLISES